MQHRDIFGIGITGKTLTDLEREILRERSPYGVVLFGRNVGTAEELRELVAEIKRASTVPPIIMIDQEGGRVDRLRHLIPGLPSVEAFCEGERPRELSEWLGKVIGMALRWFDIELDLAPVVDVRTATAPKGLERRTFGADAQTVVDLAGAFIRGLHAQGTASCLKHFPGIGAGSADPHYGATVIDVTRDDLFNRDLVPFQVLGREAGSIMIGHGTYPQFDDPELPATLSRRLTHELARDHLGYQGLIISDDMEMHAVSDLGSYESLSERALMAGNDIILFCSHIERIPDLQRYVTAKAASDAAFGKRLDDATRHAERFRRHCAELRAASAPPPSFDDVVDEAARFVEAFMAARPERDTYIPETERRKQSRMPGKGRTGREEWT